MISIIVPIFNMEEYLEKALTSIAKQSIKDFEVILIDDGSKDTSAAICQNFVKQDKRFLYFFQETKGVSGARNAGLNQAKGDFIAFVDPDDTIAENYLENLLTGYKEETIDLVAAGYTICAVGKQPVVQQISQDNVISATQGRQYLFTERFFYSFLWNKLFKREIILKNRLKFANQLHYGEDLLFCDEYLRHSKQVAIIKSPGYYYWRHPNSVGESLTSDKLLKRITYIDAMIAIKENYEMLKLTDFYIVEKIALNGTFYCVQMAKAKVDQREITKLKKKIKPYVKKTLQEKIGLKNKLKLVLFFYFPIVAQKII